MNKNTVNTTEQKTKKTAKQIADEKAIFRFKAEQLKLFKVKTQKELTAEQKKEFDAKLLAFKANLQKTDETAEQKQKKEQKKEDKQKQTKEQKTKEQKQKKEAEAEKLSDIKAQYRKNSLQLNEKQAELLNDYIAEFEVMRWGCNKNMITLYYKNKQVIEIVASTRALRISTKEAFATSTYETRKSGYGVDFTKKLKDEKALATELKALVSRVKKQTAEAEKKTDKQKKEDKKEESK